MPKRKPRHGSDIGSRPTAFSREGHIAFFARVGIGHDTHRLEPGGPLVLGGLRIEHDKHAVGHSDADVLLHAITDGLLGAAGLGDIGEMFPDTDPANKGRDSAEMLLAANARVHGAGFNIANLDCFVFAQLPKITPLKAAICQRIAELLRIEVNRINLKAKTGDSVGPVGRVEAV
ncbi:MAG: 2-C-methyl-D-erythritol 2,4-cyclodiphosphate synthase, partial [Pirellulales bacterium]